MGELDNRAKRHAEGCDNESGSFLSHHLIKIRCNSFIQGYKEGNHVASVISNRKAREVNKLKQQLTQKDAEIGKLRRVINRVHKDVSNGEHIDGSWIKETFQEVQRDWIFETQNRNHKQQLTKKDAEIEKLKWLLSKCYSIIYESGAIAPEFEELLKNCNQNQ